MKRNVLYKELARYYDLIYASKDYKKEASQLKKFISEYKKSPGNELLDVACGTGRHLIYLKSGFSCMGVDISEDMLKIARKNVRGVVFKKANMITLDLGKKFDIILCMFSAIAYTKTYENLRKTIQNFANHLKKGGVVLIQPFFTKAAFKQGAPHMTTYQSDNICLARANVSKAKGDLGTWDFHYIIAEKDKEVKHFVDRHEVALFDTNKTLKIMKEVGLKAKFLKKGFANRGLFIGIKA